MFGMTKKVDSLLQSLEQMDSRIDGLGTPYMAENDECVQQLVNMGTEIVSYLLERIQRDASSKMIAYVILVLGRIGDRRAAEPLRDLRVRFQAREFKETWDYAVIGQCDVALSRLEQPLL